MIKYLTSMLTPTLAAEEEGGWIQIIISLIIIVFIFIGPILKKITEGIRKNLAQSRGVEEYKDRDDGRRAPGSPGEAVKSIFDDVAEMFREARGYERGKEPPPGRETSFDEVFDTPKTPRSRHDSPFARIAETLERPKPKRPPRPAPPPEPVILKKEEIPTAELLPAEPILPPAEPVRTRGGVGRLGGIKSVREVRAITAGRRKKKVNLLKKVPSDLRPNQKAILFMEILGPSRAVHEPVHSWEI